MLFGDPADVVAWHPANVPDSGHICGVDAGNLAVFDLVSFAALNVRQKEALYEDSVVNPSSDPMAQMLTIVNENDGVVVSSGWGDGAYPVHWGVDASGEPVVLLLDFLIACTWPVTHVDVELTAETAGTRVAAPGFDGELNAMVVEQDGAELFIPASCRTPFSLVNAAGDVIAHSSRLRCEQKVNDLVFPLSDELRAAFPFTVRFELNSGYKNS